MGAHDGIEFLSRDTDDLEEGHGPVRRWHDRKCWIDHEAHTLEYVPFMSGDRPTGVEGVAGRKRLSAERHLAEPTQQLNDPIGWVIARSTSDPHRVFKAKTANSRVISFLVPDLAQSKGDEVPVIARVVGAQPVKTRWPDDP